MESKYKIEWAEHISELKKLAWHLPEFSDSTKLRNILGQLNDLLEVANKNQRITACRKDFLSAEGIYKKA